MANFVPVRLSHQVFEPKSGCYQNLSPVIFLHGIAMVKESWLEIPQIIADKTKRKTYAYDARNHGDSEYTDAFSFDLNVDDLFHFMDTMNIQKAVLVGHSMGGLTSTNAALRKPERVEMVFSEDMFVGKMPQEYLDPIIPLLELREESVRNIPTELNEAEAIQFSADYMFKKFPENIPFFNKEEFNKTRFYLKQKPGGGYELKFNVDVVFRALKSADSLMREPCGQYNAPSYFLYGNKSPLSVNAEEKQIRKHFPKAELIEFDGATHYVHFEFPDKFTNTILQRLRAEEESVL